MQVMGLAPSRNLSRRPRLQNAQWRGHARTTTLRNANGTATPYKHACIFRDSTSYILANAPTQHTDALAQLGTAIYGILHLRVLYFSRFITLLSHYYRTLYTHCCSYTSPFVSDLTVQSPFQPSSSFTPYISDLLVVSAQSSL